MADADAPLTVSDVSIDQINDRLTTIRDQLDALKGLRGPIQCFDNLQYQQTVATADLPVGATEMDGTILIENESTTHQNLILYGAAKRFRIDGGTAF